MSDASTPVAPARRRLPVTVYILAGVMAFKAILLVTLVAGANVAAARPIVRLSTTPELIELVATSPWTSGVLLLFALLLGVSVVGVLSRRRIGWLLAMVVTGLFVATDIWSYANGSANHMWMALNIITVFYLNQRDVREVFGAAGLAAEPATTPEATG